MPFVKKLNSLVTVKRKTSTDRQPTGFLGANSIIGSMIQDATIPSQKLQFGIPSIVTGVTSTAIQGKAVTYNGTQFVAALADNVTNSRVHGIIVNDSGGNPTLLFVNGAVVNVFSGLLPGATYYLSQTTPGSITPTAPIVGKVCKVGRAIDSTRFVVEILWDMEAFSGGGGGGGTDSSVVSNAPGTGITVLDFAYFNGSTWLQLPYNYFTTVSQRPLMGTFASFSGGIGSLYTQGVVPGFTSLTPGADYFIDPANPGKIITLGSPTHPYVRVGKALNSTTLFVQIVLSTPTATNPIILTGRTLNGGTTNNQVVYKGAGANFQPALATQPEERDTIGIVQNVVGTTGDIYTHGLVSGLSGLSPGSDYFIDPSTPGAFTTTAPTGSQYVFLGRALSATEMFVNPIVNNTFRAGAKRQIIAWAFTGQPAVGDTQPWLRVPFDHTLVSAYAVCKTAGSTQSTINIYFNPQSSIDTGPSWTSVFSTPITIDNAKRSSLGSAVQPVLSAGTVVRSTNDHYKVEVTTVGTGITDISVILEFRYNST
jgi:hypothetical protein